MKRTAKAQWTGSVKEGKGELTTQSEILNKTNYSFKTRFTGEEKGTNPEELLTAAHAGCFTMAVSYALTEQGTPPTSLTTITTLSMEGFDISGMHLSITGIVPGISSDTFNAIVKVAEKDCLISKALSLQITSEAHLAFIEN